MKLWLDDVRDPAYHGRIGYVWAKTYFEAIEYLRTGEVTIADLDHDLGILSTLGYINKELTGYDVVTWMEMSGIWPKDGVFVHSMNPVGKRRMEQVINKYYLTKRKE